MKRRQFLSQSSLLSCASLIPASLSPALFAESPQDFRCLVNIFLLGGNDSFNLLTPRSEAEYNTYADSRQNLSIPQDQLLPINSDNPDGNSYGFHPSATALQSLFEQGDLSIVANVGPLIEPTTKDSYLNNDVSLPPQLFSHNDQQSQWQTLKGISQKQTGWAGRLADVFETDLQSQSLPTNISTSGNSSYLTGLSTRPYSVSNHGATAYQAYRGNLDHSAERLASFTRELNGDFVNVHARSLAFVHKRSIELETSVNQALSSLPDLQTPFPDSRLGRQLNIIARLLAVKDEFEMRRQIFYATTGGFDTHDNQNRDQPTLFSDLDGCMAAFQNALTEINLGDQVVTFTQSDFGRTLTSNGDGTDHGWGSHQLVMGNPVVGRQIFGQMPILEIDGNDDISGGRLIPTLSADQYAATLASWFGIADQDLGWVAPHITNFNARNLGFLA